MKILFHGILKFIKVAPTELVSSRDAIIMDLLKGSHKFAGVSHAPNTLNTCSGRAYLCADRSVHAVRGERFTQVWTQPNLTTWTNAYRPYHNFSIRLEIWHYKYRRDTWLIITIIK